MTKKNKEHVESFIGEESEKKHDMEGYQRQVVGLIIKVMVNEWRAMFFFWIGRNVNYEFGS